MTVQQLIEDLKQAPPESLVCFEGNGIWAVAGVEVGKMPGQQIGYVKLCAGRSYNQHNAIRKNAQGDEK